MSDRPPGDPPALRLDVAGERAWCGARALALTPRNFAVLRYLAERRGRLVTKDDLFAAVWRDAVVSDAALASSIRDLRRALGEPSDRPRYIETVHRRGFRFIGPVAGGAVTPAEPEAPTAAVAAAPLEAPPILPPASSTLVGRDADLARLSGHLQEALAGRRQLVFVTGEPGIGKTAFVELFLAEVARREALRVGRGQCVEQYGAGEAYLPVLEALGRLGRGERGERLVEVLKRQAPTWLAELPGLLSDADLDAVRQRGRGATRDRMLRELVEGLDALTGDAPLVLLLEDLHWSDSATIDLLAMLARRREPSRLLVLATYRPAEVAGAAHPLRRVKQELQLHGFCDEIALEFLSASMVGEYLARRFPAHRFPAALERVLHRNTDGNPLFLANTVDYLIAQGRLREADGRWTLSDLAEAVGAETPRTLQQIVERQLERLPEDMQAMLAVAAVAGAEFSTAVAPAGGISPPEAEERCAALARGGQFLRAAGVAEWPDGTVAGRYAFIHALYQQVLYARVPAGERAGLHRRAGSSLERGYGARAGEIAGELAMHFEQGRDLDRAVGYRRQAAENALRQQAYREAADHATRALDLLAALAAGPGRARQELALQVMLGSALTVTQGYTASDVAQTYARVRALSEQEDDAAQLFPVLLGLGRFHNIRGEVEIARGVGTRLLGLAEATADAAMRVAAHNAVGIMAFHSGDLDAALAHLDRGTALYDPARHRPDRSPVFRVGPDPGVSCHVYAALSLQLQGYPARAVARARAALELARSLDHPFSLAYACHFGAALAQWRGEPAAVRDLESQSLACSSEHGLRLFPMVGAIQRGWAVAMDGRGADGLALVQEGLAASRAMGMELRRPSFLGALAEVCREIGRPEDGLLAVIEALAVGERTGQRYWDAELHRLKGQLELDVLAREAGGRGRRASPAADGAAEASFLAAVEVARGQRARWLELRAATSLARLWAGGGRAAEARALLAGVHGWFTEGFDTPDLLDARSLIDSL